MEIWGDGTIENAASDLADAVFCTVDDFKVRELFNCGVGCDYTINEYYNEVARVVGWTGKFVHDLSKPSGMQQTI